MEPIYVLFIAAIGILIAIGVGISLSKDIDNFIEYVLFWIMYIITLVTFINIILLGKFYFTMKNKSGIPGSQGPQGDSGIKGDVGVCDPKCRDSICSNKLNELIIKKLTDENKGAAVKMNNIYIKSKIQQMCASDEFKQLAPYNGPQNLINYMTTIWSMWFDMIYAAGGIKYFENIGAESDFEWMSSNPFDEIKKYDVYYWGMGKSYRPQIIDKCYTTDNGNTPNNANTTTMLRVSNSNLYTNVMYVDDIVKTNRISFWRANQFTYKGAVYYPVGDIAVTNFNKISSNFRSRSVGNFKIPSNTLGGPDSKTIIVSGDLEGPIGYEMIWTNDEYKGTSFWIWRPIPPVGYTALGDIVTDSEDKPPTGNNAPIRCVPDSYITSLNNKKTINKTYNTRLWNSTGSKSPMDVNLLSEGIYNLFRAVLGASTSTIPETDINGNFYTLDTSKYDDKDIIGGENTSIPPTDKNSNRVGKGYLPSPQRDVKYSVLSYLNLKNNATLTHSKTQKVFNAKIVPNAISNAYLISVNGKCLNYDEKSGNDKVEKVECDELKSNQIFSIIFTGNKTNECKLQHYDSKKILQYKSGLFTVVNNDVNVNNLYILFIMS
jgi:hypothetical protein